MNNKKSVEWSQIQKQFPEANFLQSPEWGKMNELIGHKTIFADFNGRGWCQMIVKNAKRGRYLEIPGGPLLDWGDEVLVAQAFAEIKAVAQREKCVFVRLRPQLRADAKYDDLLKAQGCQKAPMHLHAEHTVMLDLTKSEEDLLKEMRRQTRYEVRRSERLGIGVWHANSEKIFCEFHTVQAATAARQGFIPPDLHTLLAERTAFGQNIQIYVSQTNDAQPIAYGMIFWSGDEAEYFEAASTELNHNVPGAYALQWQAIKDLKKLGLKRYNLWGIAPKDVHGKVSAKHRYAGVTTFKTGFGGEIVEFVAAQDIVINQPKYLLNWLVETIRRKVRKL